MPADTPVGVAFRAPSAANELPRGSGRRARPRRRRCRRLAGPGRLLTTRPTRAARAHRRRSARERRTHPAGSRTHSPRPLRPGHRPARTRRRGPEVCRPRWPEPRGRRRRPEAEGHDQGSGARGEDGAQQAAQQPGAEHHAGGVAAFLRHHRGSRGGGHGGRRFGSDRGFLGSHATPHVRRIVGNRDGRSRT